MKIKSNIFVFLLIIVFSTSSRGAVINDFIDGAIGLTPSVNFIEGDTFGATLDTGLPFAGASITSPGVWYYFLGDGGLTTIDTNALVTNFDTKLSVYTGYTGDVNDLESVGGNDDSGNCDLAQNLFCSSYSFNSTLDQRYYLLVHGFGGEVGNFGLNYTGVGQIAAVSEPSNYFIFAIFMLSLSRRLFIHSRSV